MEVQKIVMYKYLINISKNNKIRNVIKITNAYHLKYLGSLWTCLKIEAMVNYIRSGIMGVTYAR